jgi:hypothetical protein
MPARMRLFSGGPGVGYESPTRRAPVVIAKEHQETFNEKAGCETAKFTRGADPGVAAGESRDAGRGDLPEAHGDNDALYRLRKQDTG